MAANATSTHPPIDERIRILRSMGGGASFRAYDESYRKVRGGGGVIPGSALKDDAGAAAAPRREAPRPEPAARKVRAREVDDFLYGKEGYRRIPCACGTVLKIPPGFASPGAKCPRCGTVHKI